MSMQFSDTNEINVKEDQIDNTKQIKYAIWRTVFALYKVELTYHLRVTCHEKTKFVRFTT